ncbi:copper chaperone PCu(A)C [Vibrio algarum]|uniref:Copper chaperone PCu(A)C n=1 Tax=Vibrio algarum TaxID=3020714 RepID=A0ABT4YVS9_9VIBR|nr:copper chaperone PCu(A)C [Vibrio sp. KJ40-1]MDB1125689.1 copper chaperone PCu(A)C [Vibrio sp. KJ40-1]
MKQTSVILASTLSLLLSSFAFASDVIIDHPYARATPPNAPTSAVFLVLNNSDNVERSIVSASTPAAGKVELHTHVMDGDVMKMRQVDSISIPAQGQTVLKPGGLHIMLFELQQDFKEGGQIDVTVNFANGESQSFTAKIKKVMKGMMKH